MTSALGYFPPQRGFFFLHFGLLVGWPVGLGFVGLVCLFVCLSVCFTTFHVFFSARFFFNEEGIGWDLNRVLALLAAHSYLY